VWFSHNGERLGTYNGHSGAVWTVHVNRNFFYLFILIVATSTLLATGSADNTMKLWNVQDGTCLHTWEFPTAVKRVEFSSDGSMLLAVTEQRMGYSGSVDVFEVNVDGEREP
jgi:translation initiation factor 3 subunit I